MRTTYSCSVYYRHDGARTDSITLFGNDNLNDAKAQMLNSINFYASIDDVKVTNAVIEEHCKVCDGRKEVYEPYARKRGGRMVKCPECKGKGEVSVIFEFNDKR